MSSYMLEEVRSWFWTIPQSEIEAGDVERAQWSKGGSNAPERTVRVQRRVKQLLSTSK